VGAGFARFSREPARDPERLRYIVAVAQETQLRPPAASARQPARVIGGDPEAGGRLGAALIEAAKARSRLRRWAKRIVEQAQKVLEESARNPRESPRRGATSLVGLLKLASSTRSDLLIPDLVPERCIARAPDAADIEENLTEHLESRSRPGASTRRSSRVPFQPPGVVTEFLYEEPSGRRAHRAQMGEAQSIAPGRAPRRAHDPAERRPLLPRPGARCVPELNRRRGAGDAHQFARDCSHMVASGLGVSGVAA